ncbi:MAG: aminoacyl--tRNA ligase-related protein [Patescibacteria group bacterium]
MRQSRLFTKTRKEGPSDELAKNAKLLIRSGYISKEMAGAYSYLPLGLRVIEKIKQIIREEMGSINSQEILMTTLQRKELWEKTDRWDDSIVDVWFKSELHSGGEVGFGWSHEEPIGEMMKNYISSYKDMPISVYQFQTKLRNEVRAKSGVMRGREFLMKDMYSFCADESSHLEYYESSKPAYMKVYERLGIGEDTYVTFAAGGAFTKFSHEFQTVCEAGEDIVYLDKGKGIAINEEVLDEEVMESLGVTQKDLVKTKTAEVGNIFNFGQQKASELELFFKDEKGKKAPVWIGSYGIGVSRLMAVLVEKFADDKGMSWPLSVAPFSFHLLEIGKSEEVSRFASDIYSTLSERGVEVLWDDRRRSAGEKFADADLIGIPYQIIVSDKGISGGEVELKERATGKRSFINEADIADTALKMVKNNNNAKKGS